MQYLLQQHYTLLANVGVDIWRDSIVTALMIYQLKVVKPKGEASSHLDVKETIELRMFFFQRS